MSDWATAQNTDPKALKAAFAEIGTLETPGPKSNPKIMGWADEVGAKLGIKYSDDSVPWCGLFVGVCIKRAGYVPPNICVRAREWEKFGNPIPVGQGLRGDVVVFTRAGGGHVGFIVGESPDGKYYYVLGGNQSDAVNIKMFDKSRVTAVRRPPYKNAPKNVRRISIGKAGEISHNEA